MKNVENTSAKILAQWQERLDKAEDKAKELSVLNQELTTALVQEKAEEFLERATLAANDANVAREMGVRSLTQEETKFFNDLGSVLTNPKQALTTAQTSVIPTTTVNRMMEDLKQDHSLLSMLDLAPAGLTKWIVADFTGAGGWGALNEAIIKEISATISEIDLEVKKASAFMAVIKGIVDLGAQFVELYIRETMMEVLEATLEGGVIAGKGTKDEPVGMDKDLSKPVDPVTGYVAKTPVVITDFGPASYGAACVPLTKGGKRKIEEVVLICNPVDYLTKVMPATTIRTPQGTYASNFPIPTVVKQSIEVAENKAILGIPKQYTFGVSRLSLAVYGEIRALNDEYLYIAKAYANGQPKDNYSFVVLDITNVAAFAPAVNVTNVVKTKEQA